MGTIGSYFQGKSILVTGAGRGLGKRFSIGFAKLGARVGLIARSKAELEATQLEIAAGGGEAHVFRTDVCSLQALSESVEAFGGIDAAICAAGVLGPIGPFATSNIDAWNNSIHTNLIGVSNTLRVVLGPMMERRSGKIVVLTGPGTESGRPGFSAYAASKTAVARLVETLADELRDANVQVNCVNPGNAYTSATDEILRAGELVSDKERESAAQARVNGGASADAQMELLQFLLSDRSNHVSGKLILLSDDWKRLAQTSPSGGSYALRRVVKQ